MKTLKDLSKGVVAFRDARQWKKFHTPKDMAISLLLEAAETAEHFQWKTEQDLATIDAAEQAALGAELSDVLYWVMLIAHDFGIDLEKSFDAKMIANDQKYPVEKAGGNAKKYTDLK